MTYTVFMHEKDMLVTLCEAVRKIAKPLARKAFAKGAPVNAVAVIGPYMITGSQVKIVWHPDGSDVQADFEDCTVMMALDLLDDNGG